MKNYLSRKSTIENAASPIPTFGYRTKVLSLALVAMAALSGCSKADSDTSNRDQVGPMSFAGKPKSYAGLYTGKCTIQTQDRTVSNYTVRIDIKGNRDLRVRTQFFIAPSSRRKVNVAAQIFKIQLNEDNIDSLTRTGNSLADKRVGVVGSIGEDGFGFRREDGSEFLFRFVSLNHYEFRGTFQFESTQPAFAVCQVTR